MGCCASKGAADEADLKEKPTPEVNSPAEPAAPSTEPSKDEPATPAEPSAAAAPAAEPAADAKSATGEPAAAEDKVGADEPSASVKGPLADLYMPDLHMPEIHLPKLTFSKLRGGSAKAAEPAAAAAPHDAPPPLLSMESLAAAEAAFAALTTGTTDKGSSELTPSEIEARFSEQSIVRAEAKFAELSVAAAEAAFAEQSLAAVAARSEAQLSEQSIAQAEAKFAELSSVAEAEAAFAERAAASAGAPSVPPLVLPPMAEAAEGSAAALERLGRLAPPALPLIDGALALCQLARTARRKVGAPAAAAAPAPPAAATREELIAAGVQTLDRRLAQLQMQRRAVAGDGACQFRALALQLHGSEALHAAVRAAALARLAADADTLVGSVFATRPELEAYLREMAQPRAWGDELTLRGAAGAYQCTIHVITSLQGHWYLRYAGAGAPQQGAPPAQTGREVFLSYISPVHYDAIEHVPP